MPLQVSELLAAIEDAADSELPVEISAYDGSRVGPANAPATIHFKTPAAFKHLLMAPGELGFGRAFVNGDIDVSGDIYAALELKHLMHAKLDKQLIEALVHNALPLFKEVKANIPAEEIRMQGKLHGLVRDKQAVSAHYDASNDFYRLLLGPTMVYSCAVRESGDETLEQAQINKVDLICRKLALQPGMRLLDIGCGWGQLVIHAAEHYRVHAVGLTLSAEQARLARERTKHAGVEDLVEIREQDYRSLPADEMFDAICSVGMFEHVGRSQAIKYFETCYSHLRPAGRFLNHAIARAASHRKQTVINELIDRAGLDQRLAPFGVPSTKVPATGGFMDRYVFPDAELHEIGQTITWMQQTGFEPRHTESLREHYAWTARQWVSNLREHWDEAVAEVGEHRARIWLLYLAGASVSFDHGSVEIYQTLGVKSLNGISDMPLRPTWEVKEEPADVLA